MVTLALPDGVGEEQHRMAVQTGQEAGSLHGRPDGDRRLLQRLDAPGNGAEAGQAGKAPIDCFYVYPTVSEQEGPNANLEIEPQEKQIAIDQASRFSQSCRVFAPMYRQLTLKAISSPGGITLQDELIAYEGVLGAFLESCRSTTRAAGSCWSGTPRAR